MTHQAPVPLADLLNRARQALSTPDGALPPAPPATDEAGCVVFLAMGEGESRARVVMGRGPDTEAAWQAAAEALAVKAQRAERPAQRLRAEIVEHATPMTWGELKARLAQTKRNYFNEGIALDARFETALLAQEMHGSAVLYNGTVDHAEPNSGNLRTHTKRRFGDERDFPTDDAAPVWCFTTRAVYVDAEGAWPLTAQGQAAGFRTLTDWNAAQVRALVDSASDYLAEQVKPTGEFHYGWFPCFDRAIPTYNTLRHASSTYAMLEGWELTRSDTQKAAIDRALAFLSQRLIRRATLADGTQAAFLVDIGNEIKLGGNAVCLLALVKYTELTGDAQYQPLMEQLALGIRSMQDPETGRFVHVLNHPGLDVKEPYRIIYYDGEAAFGLMRLYGLTRDARWLAVVEKAFEHFIAAGHWRAHDHWLSYCVNELTRFKPETRYYQFGLQNMAGHLDFVLERITTFPTLLELMMAAREMVLRLEADPALRSLLAGLDRHKFDRALEHRARYLANGHFWPELAMFFRHPDRIAGSFFIKHHSFRVRIDDVEHYLSGYVAYHRLLEAREAQQLSAQLTLVRAEPTAPRGAEGIVLWGGDVNLGRRQHYRMHDLGGPARMLGDIAALREVDLRIVNLECVVATTGEQGVEKDEGGPYYYRARPEMLSVLTEAGIDMVATANNHSGDYGPEALLEQHGLLNAAAIAFAGTGTDLDSALSPAFRQAGGLRVALFSLDATQPRFAATAKLPGAAWLSLDDPAAWRATLAPRIAAARHEADVVLVAVHWGENLETAPSRAEIAVGHAIVEAGADAVLGTSAHVLQGIEVHQGRPILHDAGDLLFDAIRNDLADSGVFSLRLGPHGVEEVVFTPVGVGFGFSQQLAGEAAEAASARFAELCRALGTEMTARPDGRCALQLSPPERTAPAGRPPLAPLSASRPPALVGPVLAPRPEWSVDAVPEDARIRPLQFGPLRLVGIRLAPTQIIGRRLLWVESFWTADAPVSADLRVQFRALPMRSTTMPAWGEAMDHDPCDWMWPTSRWTPGRIYRDRYGLRAPRLGLLENDVLQIEVRVRGSMPDLPGARRLPVWCGLRVPKFPTPLPERPAPVLAALRPGAPPQPSPVWTADELQRVTGGQWLVPPPSGWFVNAVVRGPTHMARLPKPALFIASDYRTLAKHENYSKPRADNPDRHEDVPVLQHALAGAVVAHPVDGLDPSFPLLQVDDPIRAMIDLGVAARARFQGRVVGVTGTVGKSSTIAMLRDLLPEAARVHTTIDNYNSRVGVPAMLANLAADADVCVLEMAQSALWMDRGPISLLARPHVAILTEIGLSQTRQTATLEQTAEFKSRIFLGLEPGGVAIVPDHIPCLMQVVRAAARTAGAIWVVGSSPDANIRIVDTRPEPDGGCRVRIALPGRTVEYLFPIASAGLVRNSALAFAALLALGFDAEAACARMPFVRLPASVMQLRPLRTQGGVQATLIDDSWNAEVMSMRNAMEFVRTCQHAAHGPVTRKIGVLGRIINLDKEAEAMHRSLAAPLLASGIQHLVTHGAEMRWLREEVPAELLGPHFEDAAQLTGYLGEFLRDGDLVLVKGDRQQSDFGLISELLQKL
ncbi:UDP-N-acetylmuramyl pentapeptide synthase [Variovorax boronicumulans]|uniref:UDP-N-acetylmuramyl pentapeptide synthase n=1 Tax=Variovorax boronicumulans TaxID=436515 RepID=A0AAW8E4N2_9BURK|nr:CapA family protein [Variovorax boronicumulans]MDP9881561.1 UDP-N-acetylmuramyl pentapeptide synthase [Variovorax boronicumulans]MDP9926848.1 UDP-N-acetylmuramyl pentapeptide synthase [Variovorax boronicumulans]